ncbi:MAG: metal ABC transporter ATP-binding protein [Eubacteriales bacterium]|jgi:zinc transport system ATP-binding protein|nr:metal ABC transporter ATP-binding protein [Eubacteriales bacterium]
MIKAENLTFSYTGAAPYVLNGINLEIKKGEYLSIIGSNGSGKSTLIQLMLRFLKPTRGKITNNAKRMGYVPQRKDFNGSNFPITVYEALNSYRKIIKVKDKNAVYNALRMVGMVEFKDALMGTLSGGQSQKIFIARALMGEPELLLLDEPSTGIDSKSQEEIYSFLKKMNMEKNITIVSVEHNLSAAISNSTLIYHLDKGKGHLCTPKQYAEEFLNINGEDNNA